MSVQSEIERISENVASTYSVLDELGVDMPAEQNTDNLAETAATVKAVRYNAQTLTAEDQQQARTNIGAASSTEVSQLSEEIVDQYAKKSAIPTKVSQLTNDSGYLTEHQDLTPYAKMADLTAHTGNSTVHVTAEEKAAWNGKSNFSGSYNDLKDRPTIPTVPTKVSAFTNDAGYLTQHQDISGKANVSDLKAHTVNSDIHVTAAEKAAWNENVLPSVSPSDSGKILMVNSSGVPAWTTITNAEGVSY